MRTDGRTDIHDEANSRIRSFANAPKHCYPNVYRTHISDRQTHILGNYRA